MAISIEHLNAEAVGVPDEQVPVPVDAAMDAMKEGAAVDETAPLEVARRREKRLDAAAAVEELARPDHPGTPAPRADGQAVVSRDHAEP